MPIVLEDIKFVCSFKISSVLKLKISMHIIKAIGAFKTNSKF